MMTMPSVRRWFACHWDWHALWQYALLILTAVWLLDGFVLWLSQP